jgi:hypothetical protein
MSVSARKDDLALKIRLDSSIKNDTRHLRAICKKHVVQVSGHGMHGAEDDTPAL